jgi:hypothetical protein
MPLLRSSPRQLGGLGATKVPLLRSWVRLWRLPITVPGESAANEPDGDDRRQLLSFWGRGREPGAAGFAAAAAHLERSSQVS